MADVEVPDFNDMYEIAEKVSHLIKNKLIIENAIKAAESDITRKAMTDTTYYVNGKQPSMDFIKNAYLQTGFSGELNAIRTELAVVIAELKKYEMVFQIYQDKVDVYRTESANQRRMTL